MENLTRNAKKIKSLLLFLILCGGGTDTLRQSVTINQPCLSVNSTSITCANLGSATVTPLAGIGPYSYTWTPGSQNGSVATGLSPGNYTISVYDMGNNFTYSSTTVLLPLIPLTGTVNSTNTFTCNGAMTGTGSITNLAGGSGAQSYLWSNGAISYTTANVNSLSAGLWSVTVTDSLTGCTVNDLLFITQPPAQTVSIVASSPTACAGSSIVLTGTNSGGTPGYTFNWTNGPPGNTTTVTEPIAGTYVYTLNSTDSYSCPASNTIAVDFIPNPVLTVSDVSICPLQTGTLSVTGANSYTWNTLSTGNTFTASPLINQQYTVTGEALSCTSIATASIILKPVPIPLVGSNSPLCNATNLLLFANGGTGYSWNGPLSYNSLAQNPVLNAIGLTNAGVYNLTVTAANSCTAAASTTVVVNPTPTISAAGSTVCTSQTLNLSSASLPGASFAWSGPLNFSSSQQNATIVTPSVMSSGMYTVIATSAVGCTNIAVAMASVVPPPSLTVSLSNNGTLCAQALNGSPNTITLTSGGAANYTLTTPNHFANPNPNGPVSPLISLPPFQATTTISTATLVGSNGICTSIKTVTFTIIPNPTVAMTPTPIICAGQSFTYQNSGATSYTWGPNTPGLTVYTGPITVASPTVTSVYSVIGGSLGCNSGTETSTITVYPIPTLSVTPDNPFICLNNKIDLIAHGTGTSYTWSPPNGLNVTGGATVNAGPLQSQTYSVLTAANNCTNMVVTTLSVLALPVPSVSILKPAVCLNEEIILKALKSNTFTSYNWKGPQDMSSGASTFSFVAFSSALGGSYSLSVTDIYGCVGITYTNIVIYDLPHGNLVPSNLSGCVPFSSDFTYYPAVGSSSVTTNWQLGKSAFQGNKFSYLFKEPGDYLIKGNLRDTIHNCLNTLTLTVTGYPVPVANFNWLPEQPVEGMEEVVFTNASAGANQSKWSWFFINDKGFRSDNENTSYSFNEAGTYPIAMIVENTYGCADTIVKTVIVDPDFNLFVPNAFTPNGDDRNEIFLPVVRSVKKYNLQVFNRWGQLLFATTDPTQGWDGSFNSEPCKMDTYVWKITLTSTVDGRFKESAGSVSLIR